MFRKAILLFVPSMLLLGLFAGAVQADSQSADQSQAGAAESQADTVASPSTDGALVPDKAGPREPDLTCQANDLGTGIYPPSAPKAANKGKFDLSFAPDTHGETTTVTGGAVLCGTDPEADKYYLDGVITYPNKGEIARCAGPKKLLNKNACKGGNLPDKAYTGSAVSFTYCSNPLCALSPELGPLTTQTHVAYDTAIHGNSEDTCGKVKAGTLIGCFRSYTPILFVAECGSDIIITKVGSKPYQLKMLQPKCWLSIDEAPFSSVYFTQIKSLTICRYANTAKNATKCGKDKTKWLNKNGSVAGPAPFSVDTTGIVQHAASNSSWS